MEVDCRGKGDAARNSQFVSANCAAASSCLKTLQCSGKDWVVKVVSVLCCVSSLALANALCKFHLSADSVESSDWT